MKKCDHKKTKWVKRTGIGPNNPIRAVKVCADPKCYKTLETDPIIL